MIPYSRQNVTDEDVASVVDVLRSDFLTQGPMVPAFEETIAHACRADYAVSSCNATAALHLACLALGVDENSLVWVPSISFVASANCARYCGAEVDFVDVSPTTGLIDVDALEEKLMALKLKGKQLPSVLIVVHLAGQCCDMERISRICELYRVRIIEDACHAFGGSYHGSPVGSCQHSDCTIFSFHPVKPVTSAEGGMILTNNKDIANCSRLLGCHGIVRDKGGLVKPKKGDWCYEQQLLGYNYRLSDVHAALGLSQVKRVSNILQRKSAIAEYYYRCLEGFSDKVKPVVSEGVKGCAWHLFPVLFCSEKARNEAFRRCRDEGIGVNVHYEPIPKQPYYVQLRDYDPCPGADFYSRHTLSLPIFETLDVSIVDRVVDVCCDIG